MSLNTLTGLDITSSSRESVHSQTFTPCTLPFWTISANLKNGARVATLSLESFSRNDHWRSRKKYCKYSGITRLDQKRKKAVCNLEPAFRCLKDPVALNAGELLSFIIAEVPIYYRFAIEIASQRLALHCDLFDDRKASLSRPVTQ